MDRHNDIRNIMNRLDSVKVTEAAVDLETFVDQVVTYVAKELTASKADATATVESVTDLVGLKFLHDKSYNWTEQGEAAVAAGWPKNPSKEFAFINKAFKTKFGKGMYDFAAEIEDKAYRNDARSIKPEDKPIYKMMGDKMTVKVTPKWAASYLHWYKHSAKKIVVQDDGNFPEAVFGPIAFGQLGITMEDFIAWLEAHGIKQMKKPKRYKSPPPMYD